MIKGRDRGCPCEDACDNRWKDVYPWARRVLLTAYADTDAATSSCSSADRAETMRVARLSLRN